MKKKSYEQLARKSADAYRVSAKMPVVLVLDNIRSLHNVGSAFRTADSFSLQSVFLCGITGKPPHRDIHKTALGAEDTVEWKSFPDSREAIRQLRQAGFRIIAVEQAEGSRMLQDVLFDPNESCAFVFGNEMQGISDAVLALCDEAIEIPQSGTKHSLNVSVSIGIVAWEVHRQFTGR